MVWLQKRSLGRDGRPDGKIQNFSACFLSTSVGSQICTASATSLEEQSWPISVRSYPAYVYWLGISLLWPPKAAKDICIARGSNEYLRSWESWYSVSRKLLLLGEEHFANIFCICGKKLTFVFPGSFWMDSLWSLGIQRREGEEQAQEPWVHPIRWARVNCHSSLISFHPTGGTNSGCCFIVSNLQMAGRML